MALGGVSATTLAVSASDSSREAKKGALKAVGAMWLTAAGMDAFYTYNGMAVSVPGWAGRVGGGGGGGGGPNRWRHPGGASLAQPAGASTHPIFAKPTPFLPYQTGPAEEGDQHCHYGSQHGTGRAVPLARLQEGQRRQQPC